MKKILFFTGSSFMARKPQYTHGQHPTTLLVGIHAPYNKTKDIQAYFEEFKNLVRTNRVQYDHMLTIKLRAIDAANFLTKGKLEELKAFCSEHNIEEVIFSESLSAQQERNLSDYLDCLVFDRTQLILEIFEKAAHSAEGKLQVAIAMLKHKKSRLAGKGIFLGQQAGAIGVRGGPGETLKERETRHIENQIVKYKKQLEKLEKTRSVQRKRRLDAHIPQIALIGYTNAGKSTIMNTLSKANVLAEDKLFATLDTTTRELWLEGKKIGVLSDTVGFIQQLPHHLINAFKSTLHELHFADLLLHVIDLSDANWRQHAQIVHEILADLDVDKEILYVFNKADKIETLDELKPSLQEYSPHVVVNAHTKEGLAPLIDFLVNWRPTT